MREEARESVCVHASEKDSETSRDKQTERERGREESERVGRLTVIVIKTTRTVFLGF